MFPVTSPPARAGLRWFFGAVAAAALLAPALVSTARAAAPRDRSSRVFGAHRVGLPRPQLTYTPGQPVMFPRELLPLLMSEEERDVQEPGEEPAREPRDVLGLSRRDGRPSIGPNVVINDGSGDPPGATQSENTIAVHGRYLVAGWNDSSDPGTPRSFSGFGYSSDGGQTWTDGGALPHALATDFAFGDPSLTVDDDGNFYYASLYTPDGIVLGAAVWRGRFDGKSFRFGPPVYAGLPGANDDGLDKEWIAADPKTGALVLTYARFFFDAPPQIELVRSRDRGRTWSAPIVLTDNSREVGQGARPIVGPDHEVCVVYAAIDLADFSQHMRIRKSTRQGTRFGPAATIGERRGDTGIFLNVVTGPPGFNRPGGVEFPSIGIDRDQGTVHVAWPEAVDYFDDALGTAGVATETDANDLPATATPITVGAAVVGSYSDSLDADWYSFAGVAGQTVEFFLTPATGSTADGFLRLFCCSGGTADRLAYSYFGDGQAFVLYTLPSSGTYYVRALPARPTADLGGYYLFSGLHVPGPRDVARDARDVMLSSSRDGQHWTRRVVANHDAPRFDNAFPEVAVDGRGDAHLVWYDHRNDAASGILTDLYHVRVGDSADQLVSDGPPTNWNLVPSRLAPNMGDYIALAADGRNVYANWADGRLGSPDSWMATIRGGRRDEDLLAGSTNVSESAALPGSVALAVANPVRRGDPIAMSVAMPREGHARLEIFSVSGQRVRRLLDEALPAGERRLTWNARAHDGVSVQPGVYFVVLETPDAHLVRRVALLP